MYTLHGNHYYTAIEKNDNVHRLLRIELEANKKGIKFEYAKQSFSQYSKHYDSDEHNSWFCRKIIAIPVALWAGVVRNTVNIALAIFLGIPKAFSDRGRYLKTNLFNIVRNFEEMVGRIIGIAWDRFGLYLIHESQFQKGCYDIIPMDPVTHQNPPSPDSQNIHNPTNTQATQKQPDPKKIYHDAQEYAKLKNDPNKSVESFNLYLQAVNLDYPLAYFRVAKCYDEGWGVIKDKDKAMEWYEKAANKGVDLAMLIMARKAILENNNIDEAKEWMEKIPRTSVVYKIKDTFINDFQNPDKEIFKHKFSLQLAILKDNLQDPKTSLEIQRANENLDVLRRSIAKKKEALKWAKYNDPFISLDDIE